MFPKFSLLPPEVRIMIWNYALTAPRILCIRAKLQPYPPPRTTDWPHERPIRYLQFDLPNPGIILACKESFYSASKHYSPTFTHCPSNSSFKQYFDFSRDTLYLPQGHSLTELSTVKGMDKVQNIAVYTGCWEENHGRFGHRYVGACHQRHSLMTHYPNIKTLTLITQHFGFRERPKCRSEVRLVEPFEYQKAEMVYERFLRYDQEIKGERLEMPVVQEADRKWAGVFGRQYFWNKKEGVHLWGWPVWKVAIKEDYLGYVEGLRARCERVVEVHNARLDEEERRRGRVMDEV